MNTSYFRLGILFAVVLTLGYFTLQPGPRCGSAALAELEPGDLEVVPGYSGTNSLNRPDVELPTFPGCEAPDYEERARCGRRKLAQYLNKNINSRLTTGKKGRVWVAFTIDLAGQVQEAELARKADAGLAAEVMRIVGKMQGEDLRWRPAKVDGIPRAMTIALQVSFGQRCEQCDGLDEELAITAIEPSLVN
ncbi:MAG: hypothetical protein AAF840_13500 [Bacteroidota bacterium]